MHAALTFQPASPQTHFGAAHGWMCLRTLRVKDVLPCACTCVWPRPRSASAFCGVGPNGAERRRPFSARGHSSSGQGCFQRMRTSREKAFFVLPACKTPTGGLNGRSQVPSDRGSGTNGHLASQPLFEDTGGGDHRRFSPL